MLTKEQRHRITESLRAELQRSSPEHLKRTKDDSATAGQIYRTKMLLDRLYPKIDDGTATEEEICQFDLCSRWIQMDRTVISDIEAMQSRGVLAGRPDTFGYDEDDELIPLGGGAFEVRRRSDSKNGDGEPTGYRWRSKGGEEIRSYLPGESIAPRNLRGPSGGDLIRALFTGARTPEERQVMQEGVDGTGGLLVPVAQSAAIIDKLRNRTRVIQAGAQTVPMRKPDLVLLRQMSDPQPKWRGELRPVEASEGPTFGAVKLSAQSLAVQVSVSRELLEDAPNVAQILENSLSRAFALELDRAALYGSGAGEPAGLTKRSDIPIVTLATPGAIDSYDPFLDARTEMLSRNADEPTAAILSVRTDGTLSKLKDSTGQPLNKPEKLSGLRFLPTNQVRVDETHANGANASRVFMGDWGDFIWGVRQEMRVEILRAKKADTLEVVFLAYLRADFGVYHPESFVMIEGITN